MQFKIRKGTEADVPAMLQLVRELALYEKAPEAVVNTEAMMRDDGFGPHSIYRVNVAEDVASGEIVGMALYYTAYSTWKGKILYLDDLVVTERLRKSGLGKLLLDSFLQAAHEAGVEQVRWHVLDWNTPAINFYKKYGVDLDSEWIKCAMLKEEISAYVSQLNK